MTGVYKITNLITGDLYVGSSVNLSRREKQHFSKKRFGHTQRFDEDIERYGVENFSFSVLERCDKKNLKEREQHYLQKLQPKYNVVWKGCKRGNEFCERVSRTTKEWWNNLPSNIKEKIINNNLTGPPVGHEVSKETRAKISSVLTGRKQPKDVIEKRRQSILNRHKLHPQTNEGHKKRVTVGNEEFDSVKACALFLSVKPSTVSQALKKRHKVKGQEVRFVV